MFLFKKYIKWFIGGLLCLLFQSSLWAEDARENNPILIISSYNPETSQTSRNISEFLDEYKSLGGTSPVVIENMNCKSFSEAFYWKQSMSEILAKYNGKREPELIILLGQEAWSAYLSQRDIDRQAIPVLCGMVSKNAILLPDEGVDLREWMPENINFQKVYGQDKNISGYAYDYDIEANVNLILKLYPQTQHIAFISDNSYGGVAMQAYVRDQMKLFPDLDLILLDGRKHTIYTIVDQIATLPEQTVILVGTWRVDMNDSYFMKNATYSMMSANPRIPAFTLSSIGLGYWVLGGYNPQYRSIGKDLASQAVEAQQSGRAEKLNLIPNEYVFDYKKLQEFDINKHLLPPNAKFLNKELTFWEQYRYQILGVSIVFFLLFAGLLTTFYFYLRAKRVKDELLASEVELVAAKERAEESDRLKSAFLANMSHEIRTPLNAIVGFSNVLVAGDCTQEEQREFVNVIQINSDLLLRLIGDILDISRLETGRLKFSYEECNVIELCQTVLATTSYSKKEGVEYVFKSNFESFVIETDIQRLQQVLINLLSNANKFTEKGRIQLEVREDRAKSCLVFSVSDTGCGIPVEKQEKVFERFEKLDEYVQGTGLGLAICRITLGALGGKIWVDSDYKEGASFVFTHPIKRSV